MYKLIRLTKINNSVSCYFHTRSFWHSHPVAQRIKMFTLTIKIKASGNFADDSIVLTIRLILKRNIITIWEIYIYCLEEVRYSLIFSRFLYQSPIFVVIQKKRKHSWFWCCHFSNILSRYCSKTFLSRFFCWHCEKIFLKLQPLFVHLVILPFKGWH